MSFFFSVFLIFVHISSYIHQTVARDDPELSDHQIGRLCAKINQMKLRTQNETEIEKLLGEEISLMDHPIERKKRKGKGKSHHYMNNNSDDDNDGQRVDIQTDSSVGKSGLFYEVKMIGTDSSTSNHFAPLVLQQTSNDIKQGDISDSIVSAYPTVSFRGQSSPMSMNDHWYSTIMADSGTAYIPLDDCRSIIETVYNRRGRGPQLRESREQSGGAKYSEKKESIQPKSGYDDDGGNSTSIETKVNVGPDGSSFSITHIGRGESTLSASATDVENQVHGNYENSKVLLSDIVLPLIVTG